MLALGWGWGEHESMGRSMGNQASPILNQYVWEIQSWVAREELQILKGMDKILGTWTYCRASLIEDQLRLSWTCLGHVFNVKID